MRKATAMEGLPRTRLEQVIKSRGLSTSGVVREFNHRATALGIDATVSPSTLHRWVSGAERPRVGSQKVLEDWFSEPAGVLLGCPHSVPAKAICSVEDLVMTSGHESAEHAFAAAAAAIDPVAVENLQAQVERQARRFNTTPTFTVMRDLVVLRDRVYDQLDRTDKPRQKAELFLAAGQICGLISVASLDLGYADAAEQQARAALTYGQLIEHQSLQGWARALLATVAYWSGRPHKAVDSAEGGLAVTTAATVRAQLHSLTARALGQIGAREEVAQQLHAAENELDRAGADPLFDGIGGEMRFDLLRYSVCAAAAYISLGDGAAAETASDNALAQFSTGESTRLAVLAAQTDLATARTLRGDLAGAQQALGPLLEIDTERRTERLTQRAVALGRLLGVNRFHGAAEARTLGLTLEDFTRASLPRTIPAALP
ncbi:hypothetical protein ACFWPH_27560 [Nocardia sp. NPDC058499]|uniref:hypothetical protein n=1 Tax=Nocardia sp. NPDC058499 TaxID=3346530 RepID=UPI00364E4B39